MLLTALVEAVMSMVAAGLVALVIYLIVVVYPMSKGD